MSEEKSAPTKEEIMSFLKEQIEVKELQLKLQEINAGLAVARAEELKALAFIGQITNPSQKPIPQSPEDVEPIHHTITQEDLDNNPELAAEGVKVGDEILIPSNIPTKQEDEGVSAKKLKKK
jgi:hypothetical protein